MLKMSHVHAIELLVLIAGVGMTAVDCVRLIAASPAEFTANTSCHPWHGQTKTIFVNGWDRGSLNKWLSFSNDGRWLYARYDRETDAMPLYFDAFPAYCSTYKLRNDWINEGKWVSFTSNGKWLRATYPSKGDAMPVQFHERSGKYKMLNKWPGEDKWVSYTDNRAEIRAIYPGREAMLVTLKDTVNLKAPDSIKVCFDEKLSIHGGSAGTIQRNVTYDEGVEKTTTHSVTDVSRLSAELTAEIPLKSFSLSPSIQSSLEHTVQRTSSETKRMSYSESHNVDIDMSKPCFIYQPVITITYKSGDYAILKGEPTTQFSEPLDEHCTLKTYP